MEESEVSGPSQMLLVGLTYNLKSGSKNGEQNGRSAVPEPIAPDAEAEYDDITTILAIKKALEGNGCRVTLLEADKDLPVKVAEAKPDIVFNIAEGIYGRGREAQVPALLDFYKIPYSGSDATTLCIALDKSLTKRLLSTYGIKAPKGRVITREQDELAGRFHYPVIVKPSAEGSSKGISDAAIASNRKELQELIKKNISLYKQDMLVEEYISGREFTVGILGNGRNIHVFRPMEIRFVDRGNRYNIYSYNVKQNYKEYIRYDCPADISRAAEAEMTDTAKKIYEALSCRDFARIDFRLSPEGDLYFIEINPLPGLAPGYSDFPMIAEFNGMDYDTLVWNVLKSALERYGMISSIK